MNVNSSNTCGQDASLIARLGLMGAGCNMLRSCALAGAVLLGVSGTVMAQSTSTEEAVAACRDAADLAADGDVDVAIEEARWCLDVLEQIRRDAALAVFPDSQGEWLGGELDNQSAMGMTLLARSYTRADQSIEVSITTGAAGSGLAALAQLGASLGASLGATADARFRVQRRTVIDMTSSADEEVHFLIELRHGGVMSVQSDNASKSEVRRFLEGFPVAEIDDALKD